VNDRPLRPRLPPLRDWNGEPVEGPQEGWDALNDGFAAADLAAAMDCDDAPDPVTVVAYAIEPGRHR
jgi:hypothetical protein